MGERMAGRVEDLDLPAFPREGFSIDERIVDAFDADRQHQVGGARPAQRQRFTPVRLNRFWAEPLVRFLRRLDFHVLGQIEKPRTDAAMIVRQKHGVDASHPAFGEIATFRRRVDEQRLVAG